jgi:hypothetical protein
LLAVLVGAAPWIVSHTGLRDPAINLILASPSVTASSEGASFGWFSPLSVRGLHLNSTNNHIDVRVDDITAERSPWQILSSAPDLGTIKVEKPRVQLELPLDVQIKGPSGRLEPTLTAIVKDAGLTVRLKEQPEPILDVDDVSVTCRVVKTEEGRALTLDPVVLFDRRQLSTKLASKLLHLFVPAMSDTPQISGAVTLSVDKLRVPVGIPRDQEVKQLEAEGKLVLHDVSTEVKNPMGQSLVRLVADMNGKHPSKVVRLAQDDEIRFQVRDGRLYHEGLRVGFPDIDPQLQLASRGSVGLDKTLDLFVELPRLDKAQRAEKGPAKCHITGTIGNPKIAVAGASLVLRQHGHKAPVIAADGIDLNMRVEDAPSGVVLAVEPVEIFKKQKLSLGVAAGLVKLLAPDVHSDREVTGEISLSLSKLRVPLGVAVDQEFKQLEAEGKLTLHRVSSDVKSPMWQALFKVLADINDKKPAEVTRLVADAEVPFRIRDGRLEHDGMRVGFPDIDPGLVVTTRGSIGVDETLDLYVELPRLDKAQRAAKGPAKCHITGTIENPKIAVTGASLVLRQHGHKAPVIAADGIDLNMRVENSAAGMVLAVEPVEVFKKAKLDLGVAAGLVRLLAPDVHSDREVTGEISLSLSKLRVPVGVAVDQEFKRLEAEGKLTLHRVACELKSPMWQALIRMLADIHGKKPSNMIRLVEESEIHFRVRDGRLYHDGHRIGFAEIDPALVVTSRGWIATDDTLDLYFDLPRLLKDRPDRGPVQCHATGTIGQPKIAVRNAPLVVRLRDGDKAALTVDNVNLDFAVEESKNGRVLTLAPVTVFENQKLTPEVGDRLLRLIAPTLSDLTGVRGEVSLSLETFRVPLDVPEGELEKKVELAGKVRLREVSVSTKTPLLQTMVKVLADVYGKKPSDVVQVVKDADVRFRVRDGRMYHEGLRFGFPEFSPDLVVTSRGYVGLDESLDIELAVPSVLVDESNLEPKQAPPVHFRVTGTIDKPIVTEVKDVKDK